MKKYAIYDSTGNPVGRTFNTYTDAYNYKAICNRPDWTIRQIHIHIERKSTERQKRAVHFVEALCDISFTGNINDFDEVSDFLSDYLDIAKEIAEDTTTSYITQCLAGY